MRHLIASHAAQSRDNKRFVFVEFVMTLITKPRSISKRSVCLFLLIGCVTIPVIHYKTWREFQCGGNSSQNYTSKYPYIALIADDRATVSLVNAVLNVLQHIPSDWKVQIMTPDKHWPFYRQSALVSSLETGRVFLTGLSERHAGSLDNTLINLVLTSASFWRDVQGEKILFFQIDSVLCSNSSYKLKDFLKYDFIGAPWAVGGCCNGGLSLRSRSKTLQLLEHGRFRYKLHTFNEDEWFTQQLAYCGASIAPPSIARTFSVETIDHRRPFGIHNPHLSRIGRANMDRLCGECPEARSLFPVCQTIRNKATSNKNLDARH